MKSYLSFLLAFGCLYFHVGCKTQRYSADQLPDQQLLFGSGGGFSGETTEYILLKNGQLFEKSLLKNIITELGDIPKPQVKLLFKAVKQLHLEKTTVNKPGNMSYFICLKDAKSEYRSTWGSPNYQIDSTLESTYQKLMNAVKDAQAPTE